jgi:hypothetical protein
MTDIEHETNPLMVHSFHQPGQAGGTDASCFELGVTSFHMVGGSFMNSGGAYCQIGTTARKEQTSKDLSKREKLVGSPFFLMMERRRGGRYFRCCQWRQDRSEKDRDESEKVTGDWS